ncbi:MAG TPA: ribosome-associated translation inhibitor RaiA [Chloroflexota bacterium]
MKRTAGSHDGLRVRVKGKNMSIPSALHDQVVTKMSKLDRYLDRLSEIEVELWKESTREAEHQNHVEATTHVAGKTIRVTTCNSEMYSAVDQAVDKLYRQLNRTKERMKSHHATRPLESWPEGQEPRAAEEREPELRIEKIVLEPQFEDEAIENLETQQRGFYVFLNARSEQLNVLYRRDDGTYGLIEPAT